MAFRRSLVQILDPLSEWKNIIWGFSTYSISLKGAWVHVCTETGTNGIGKRAKMKEIMSVDARLSTFVFRRYCQR